MPLARYLAQWYHVVLPELRGHGKSARSDAYSMPLLVADLNNVVEHFGFAQFALIGHSLGGHVVTKYAALFSERVTALVVAEGLGPPERPNENDEATQIQRYREMLIRLSPGSGNSKSLTAQNVAARLVANNPRLAQSEALRIAPHLIAQDSNGTQWAFDSKANSVFIGTSRETDARFWRAVSAPTCIISGALSYEYWGGQFSFADSDYTGRFAEGEMEARTAEFQNAEHHWFAHSGHMIHYDEPEKFQHLCHTFLEQHYV